MNCTQMVGYDIPFEVQFVLDFHHYRPKLTILR